MTFQLHFNASTQIAFVCSSLINSVTEKLIWFLFFVTLDSLQVIDCCSRVHKNKNKYKNKDSNKDKDKAQQKRRTATVTQEASKKGGIRAASPVNVVSFSACLTVCLTVCVCVCERVQLSCLTACACVGVRVSSRRVGGGGSDDVWRLSQTTSRATCLRH